MRTPQDLPRHLPRGTRRSRIVLGAIAAVLIILVFSAKGLATFWTDYLWFQSVGFTSVFKGVLLTKIVLSVVFIAIFFVLLWTSLFVVDRVASGDVDLGETNDVVLRYRDFAMGRSRYIRLVVAAVFAVLGGIGADGQWNNWDLFRYRVNFGITDPQFHKDVGFYVFELPFIQFLITWAFEALVVVFILTTVFSYLSGGIMPQASGQRVRSSVKAHLSVILAVLALIKAVGYYYDRLALVLSRAHVVDGATATSVNADAPAKVILIAIAVISAVLFLVNLRQRSWVLPTVGVALWALVSILVGVVYPALYQAVRVSPSELTRESTYINRNIIATRQAYDINKVTVPAKYSYSSTVSSADVLADQQTISNIRLLDPAVNLLNTFNRDQALRQYYTFDDLDLDRYLLNVNGSGPTETATITSIRELNDSNPTVTSSFVNQHLFYTHGYGAVQAPISEYGVLPNGSPNFTLDNVPASSTQPSTQLNATTGSQVTGPDVYYGEGANTGGYVIAGTQTSELDYGTASGNTTTTHYNGSGGVDAGSLIRRAAFALRFSEPNFILSGQIKSTSKVIYYRNVVEAAQKAAPFLKFDSDPYAVILNGGIYWVLDAYTTSDNYPYSQEANLNGLPANSGLNTNFNYIRNSVKVVVSAYTGQMTFFDMGTHDPILAVYERAFPDLFKPVSLADSIYPGVTAHWRYPEDYFQVQTNMYGRYHLTDVTSFYSQAQSWTVSPDPGSGVLNNTSSIGATVIGANGQPQVIVKPLAPQYIEAVLPDTAQSTVNFSLITPYVPLSANGSSQNLTAFITGSSDGSTYGHLTLYQLPPNETVDGPGLIANAIHANPAISQELTLLGQQGSQVELGEVAVVPIGNSLLYVEPVYVESTSNPFPLLDDVVVVYNDKAYHSSNAAIDEALCQITNPDNSRPFSAYCGTSFASESSNLSSSGSGTGSNVNSGNGSTTTTTTTIPTSTPATVGGGSTISSLLASANAEFAAAQTALSQGNLAAYQADVNAAHADVSQAEALASAGSTQTSTPSTSTTTTKPAG